MTNINFYQIHSNILLKTAYGFLDVWDFTIKGPSINDVTLGEEDRKNTLSFTSHRRSFWGKIGWERYAELSIMSSDFVLFNLPPGYFFLGLLFFLVAFLIVIEVFRLLMNKSKKKQLLIQLNLLQRLPAKFHQHENDEKPPPYECPPSYEEVIHDV